MRLVLASASPRRRELLRSIAPQFEVVPSEIEETLEDAPAPVAVARLALRKARAVAARVREAVVLAADTVVILDGAALGKPADAREARAMLRRLRGREHEVITGVAVLDSRTGREASTSVVSRVRMAAYSDATLEAYVATGAPLDKAGAYAIQDLGGALVERLAGSYTNVVGLPVEETRWLLAEFGVPVSAPAEP
ncbi:MAG: septum formation protein Maf [Candidatus Rokubacteria bacterium 13_2_20CM_69_15_1]|nr:MAG: septum formation protein Maf [Candidatus Rokubacteria bacterium 13_2_20CM_69_15_1]